jgi:hypothetical protein
MTEKCSRGLLKPTLWVYSKLRADNVFRRLCDVKIEWRVTQTLIKTFSLRQRQVKLSTINLAIERIA